MAFSVLSWPSARPSHSLAGPPKRKQEQKHGDHDGAVTQRRPHPPAGGDVGEERGDHCPPLSIVEAGANRDRDAATPQGDEHPSQRVEIWDERQDGGPSPGQHALRPLLARST
jgi:hypothetical protein